MKNRLKFLLVLVLCLALAFNFTLAPVCAAAITASILTITAGYEILYGFLIACGVYGSYEALKPHIAAIWSNLSANVQAALSNISYNAQVAHSSSIAFTPSEELVRTTAAHFNNIEYSVSADAYVGKEVVVLNPEVKQLTEGLFSSTIPISTIAPLLLNYLNNQMVTPVSYRIPGTAYSYRFVVSGGSLSVQLLMGPSVLTTYSNVVNLDALSIHANQLTYLPNAVPQSSIDLFTAIGYPVPDSVTGNPYSDVEINIVPYSGGQSYSMDATLLHPGEVSPYTYGEYLTSDPAYGLRSESLFPDCTVLSYSPPATQWVDVPITAPEYLPSGTGSLDQNVITQPLAPGYQLDLPMPWNHTSVEDWEDVFTGAPALRDYGYEDGSIVGSPSAPSIPTSGSLPGSLTNEWDIPLDDTGEGTFDDESSLVFRIPILGAILKALKALWDLLKSGINKIIEFLRTIVNTLKDLLTAVRDIASNLAKLVKEIDLGEYVSNTIAFFKSVLDNFTSLINHYMPSCVARYSVLGLLVLMCFWVFRFVLGR